MQRLQSRMKEADACRLQGSRKTCVERPPPRHTQPHAKSRTVLVALLLAGGAPIGLPRALTTSSVADRAGGCNDARKQHFL